MNQMFSGTISTEGDMQTEDSSNALASRHGRRDKRLVPLLPPKMEQGILASYFTTQNASFNRNTKFKEIFSWLYKLY